MSVKLVTRVSLLLVFFLSGKSAAGEEPKKEADPSDTREALPAVITEEGVSMRLGLLVQAGLDAYPNQQEGHRNTFRLHRARVRLGGHLLSKNFKYRFEGDGAAAAGVIAPLNAPGTEMRSSTGGIEVPFVLDAFVSLAIPQIHLTFTFGRFIPKWGLLMPASPSDLGVFLYPLYVHGDPASIGPFRDIGLDAKLDVYRGLSIGGGVHNGGVNSWQDDNDRKDLSAFVSIHSRKGFDLRAAGLFKFPRSLDAVDVLGDEIENAEETHIAPCVEARYRNYGLDLMAGFAMNFVFRDEDDAREDYRSTGAFVHAGYLIVGDWLELAVRGEWWDPSDEEGDDDRWRIIAGPVLRIENVHLRLGVNYVQDIFPNERAMCENYLGLDSCDELESVPEAKDMAGTILLQVTLEL
jgi:hypothetical protein